MKTNSGTIQRNLTYLSRVLLSSLLYIQRVDCLQSWLHKASSEIHWGTKHISSGALYCCQNLLYCFCTVLSQAELIRHLKLALAEVFLHQVPLHVVDKYPKYSMARRSKAMQLQWDEKEEKFLSWKHTESFNG